MISAYFTLLSLRVGRYFERGFCKFESFGGRMFMGLVGEVSFEGFRFCFVLLDILVKVLGFFEIVLHFIVAVFVLLQLVPAIETLF